MALGLAVRPTKSHYQLSALESQTWGSQPLTVLYLPGSPFRHGPLSAGSDSEASDHSLTPTTGFGSSLIRQPTRACSSTMWSVLQRLYGEEPRSLLHHSDQIQANLYLSQANLPAAPREDSNIDLARAYKVQVKNASGCVKTQMKWLETSHVGRKNGTGCLKDPDKQIKLSLY